MWRTGWQDECAATAHCNAQAGHPQRDIGMLTGEGQYSDHQQQLLYDPGVYAQIATATCRAWGTLPAKGDLQGQLSKVIQGPNEPYSAFVDRLLVPVGRVFGDADQAMPLVKQLAYENANKWCKEAIRPWKHKDLGAYIKLCRDINDAVVTGSVIAAALMGTRPFGNRTKNQCFGCGQSGHFKRNCPQLQQANKVPTLSRKPPPGICPKCRKDTHWANECMSKTDLDGNPIQGNGRRGQLQAPNNMYGAAIKFVPQGSTPFTTLSEGAQAAPDWTSVPPPTTFHFSLEYSYICKKEKIRKMEIVAGPAGCQSGYGTHGGITTWASFAILYTKG